MIEEKDNTVPWNETKMTPCINPGHEVPSLLYIPPGQTYKHVCPGCQNEIVVRTPEITW